jgi:NitT/TauT family transport system permease protein
MFSLRDTFITVYKGRLYPNYWDVVALAFIFGLISLFAWNAMQMAEPYQLGQTIHLSLDPHNLPFYALRTVLRMLIALVFSLLFTLIFATWAAKNKRAGSLIIPCIDILQSVPILGFLSIAAVVFMRIFPNSLLGLECAAIFAIFTSQAWNMALGFYQTMRAIPSELHEASRMFHLSPWQRFWRIEVPYSLPGLLWNMMMSMSAGWFFVVASEAVSINNRQVYLPGIGSYIALAIKTADKAAILSAIAAMLIVILIYDQILFRPLIAWADKFKSEQIATEKEPHSWLIDLLHRTRLLRIFGSKMAFAFDKFVNIKLLRSSPVAFRKLSPLLRYDKTIGIVWNACVLLALCVVVIAIHHFVTTFYSLNEVERVFYLGMITALRVFILIVIASLIWVPIGVWVGLRPHIAEIVQPVAQFLAAFPADLLYPIFVAVIVTYHLNVNIWVTPLMILGTQWYILFNVIAGTSVLPKDLLQVADNLGLNTVLRWRRLILPAIFPYYITGAITAVGGAWNASILAEVITWGDKTLVAAGLGAYISQYTALGDFPRLALGIGTMCVFVLVLNRLIWRPLYVLAEARYGLD